MKTEELEGLVDSLRMSGENVELALNVPKIPEEILIVRDYAPSMEDGNCVCMALSCLNYPQNFSNKIWLSVPKSNVRDLNYHPDYREFCHDGVKYHPYSIALGGARFDTMGIKRVFENVYKHNINF